MKIILTNTSNHIKLFIAVVALLFTCNHTEAQYIFNGTFDGYVTDKTPPDGWVTCDYYSDPDVMASFTYPDSLDSITTHMITAEDGNTFMGMRARGKNYLTDANHLTLTREYLAQILLKPLEKNSIFVFSIYLFYNPYNRFNDTIDPQKAFPLTLELWLGNDSCPSEKLVFTSKPVIDAYWALYTDTFLTYNTKYSSIRLQSQWDIANIEKWDKLNKLHVPYNGELYLDNADIKRICIASDTIHHDLYFKGDNLTTLTADSVGESYSWFPDNNLSINGRSATMQWYDSLNHLYTVDISRGIYCMVEDFNVKFNCDILYPKKIIDTVYYKYFHTVTLNAFQGGVKYEWTPKTHLSNPNSCCPQLTGFDTSYSVLIIDKYGCPLTEIFKINALCDSLVPEKIVVVLDTTLIYNNKEIHNYKGITLKPKVGGVNDCSWSPLTGLLISDDCQTALAKPLSNRTYSVQVIDSFRCLHFEKFDIKVQQYFPNFITPNGDGHNDCFVVYGLPERTSLKIFDKSGALIYSTSSYDENTCWEGNDNKGNPVETGTYWYVLNNPESGFIKKGFVLLKR